MTYKTLHHKCEIWNVFFSLGWQSHICETEVPHSTARFYNKFNFKKDYQHKISHIWIIWKLRKKSIRIIPNYRSRNSGYFRFDFRCFCTPLIVCIENCFSQLEPIAFKTTYEQRCTLKLSYIQFITSLCKSISLA